MQLQKIPPIPFPPPFPFISPSLSLCPLHHHHHHHHHFICPIIQQYAHLHEYDSTRAGQQGPMRTLTAALKRSINTVTGCIFYHTNKNNYKREKLDKSVNRFLPSFFFLFPSHFSFFPFPSPSLLPFSSRPQNPARRPGVALLVPPDTCVVRTAKVRIRTAHFTIRYDTRCYFNVRSKANTSQLNLPHGNDN